VAATVEDLAVHWIDAADLARLCGLPQNLQDFCNAIGIPAKKDGRGTRLINKYSKPQEDGTFRVLEGEDRQAFEEYCLQDVVLLEQAWRFLAPLVPEWERDHAPNLVCYEKMNARGVPIDVDSAEKARALSVEQEVALNQECRARFSFSLTQPALVGAFLGLSDVERATLENFHPKDPNKLWVRDARLAVSKAAAKKLVPMIELACEGGRIRGSALYHGAHTGRGTSRGVQFQNLKKGKVDEWFFECLRLGLKVDDPIGDTQKNIRGFIKAEEGRTFVIVDYAQVEARLLAWMSGQQDLVEAFVRGEDIYRGFASDFHGVPPVDISDEQRAHGKAVILGCGYGMGAPRFVVQAAQHGSEVPLQLAYALVSKYREKYPNIPKLWDEVDKGVKSLLRGYSDGFSAGKCAFSLNKHRTMMKIVLPSGRSLRYFMPRVDQDRIIYRGRFGWKQCWGGHFVENVCQAMAADLKMDAMKRADILGFSTVLEVHDELVIEETYELSMVMADPPDWMDVAGLIIGDAKVSTRFTK
jgi:DNA polymerase